MGKSRMVKSKRQFRGAAIASAHMPGEMAEWLKAHAWKACVPQGTVGSNPTLSAIAIESITYSTGTINWYQSWSALPGMRP